MRHLWGLPEDDESVPRFKDSHWWVHEWHCVRCKTVFTEALDPDVSRRDDCTGYFEGEWRLHDYEWWLLRGDDDYGSSRSQG